MARSVSHDGDSSKKSIIIIGGGMAGLAAGCYGQMNGYQTQIFELHTSPGGLCTAWKRKGYTFDGCIHWLVGSRPGSAFNRYWQEVGATQGRTMVDHDEFMRLEEPGGKTLILYTDADRLEQHLLELAPSDADVIREITGTIRLFTRMDSMPDKPRELLGAFDMLRMMPGMIPLMRPMNKYSQMTMQELGEMFSDPFLRTIVPQIFGMPDFPAAGFLFTMAWMHVKDAGYPIGGSLEFSRAIERRYRALGGEIRYNARVEEILVEGNRAAGVRLVDGSEHRADVVISAADGHATIFDMLEGKFINDEIKGYFENMPIFEPIIQVSLGVNRDFSDQPHHVVWALEEPVNIAGKRRERIEMKHYCYDPTLAPEGKSVVEVMFDSNYAYWRQLADVDRERYEAEKQQIAETVIAQLERRYPGLTDQIEAVDVATPLTYERYTGNWQGSFEGWRLTTETMSDNMKGKGMSKTLPGLGNFYMAGQWVEPGGGLPTALKSGRDAIYLICHADGKRFEATVP